MRIGEVARRGGVTTKAIRFYEQAGVMVPPVRLASGYRDYDDAAVDRLAFVKAAQAAGLTLAEIRDVIAARDASGSPCEHLRRLLDTHAAALDERILELARLRREVEHLRRRAATLDPAACTDAAVCHLIPGRPSPTSSEQLRGGPG